MRRILDGASRLPVYSPRVLDDETSPRPILGLLILSLGSPALGLEPVSVGPPFEVHSDGRVTDPVTGLFLEGFCCVPRMAGDDNGSVMLTWTGDPSQEGLDSDETAEGVE